MKEENEINEEVRELLDSLEQHGRNARRQQELSELIDKLASGTSLRGGTTKQSRLEATPQSDASTSDEASSLDCFVPRNDAKRRRLIPLWWAMGAAAACLLLWLLVRPTTKQNPEMNEIILAEETKTVDSIKTEVNDATLEEPIILEEPLAEEAPVSLQKTQIMKEKPRKDIIEKVVVQPVLAEVTPTEPKDTTKIESSSLSTSNEDQLSTINCQLSTNNSPQRRVVRSLNLVCYECQKEIEEPQLSTLNPQPSTIFGQLQDPNMKNGSWAFELKLQ